jgi:hypothetical protein
VLLSWVSINRDEELFGEDSTEVVLDRFPNRHASFSYGGFASECFLCWDDGTLCHPDDGDIGSVRRSSLPVGRRSAWPSHGGRFRDQPRRPAPLVDAQPDPSP